MAEVKKYAFDLDGTVTVEETLPVLAAELGIREEMSRLTELTLAGEIPFAESFRRRCRILSAIPLERIQGIMAGVKLDEDIAAFIVQNAAYCAIVTGNLDVWIAPILRKLGCRCYASRREIVAGREVVSVCDKRSAIEDIRRSAEMVVAVGESFNDITMFEAADIAIAYCGVHHPVAAALDAADYAAFSGVALVELLNRL